MMNYLPHFCLLALGGYVSAGAFGQNTADSALNVQHDFGQFQQQSKQPLEQIQQAQQERWLKQHQYQATPPTTAPTNATQTDCLPYQKIHFLGFELIDPQPLAPSVDECLNEARLNQLSRDITALYLKKGYIHQKFELEEAEDNALIMRVYEGKIRQIRSDSPRVNVNTILPNWQNKPLKIQDLDQSLDQANKLSGSRVTVDVLPEQEGHLTLAFTSQDSRAVQGFIGADNSLSDRSGRWQAKAGVNVDNPLGLSDTLYLNAQQSVKSLHHNTQRSATIYYAVPYGYWTVSGFASLSNFKSQTPLVYRSITQKGKTWQAGVKADYVFHRGANHISSIYGQLEHIDSKSYFEDTLIELQSPKLSDVQVGINHLQLFPKGSLVGDVRVERGLKWHASASLPKEAPQAQYTRLNADLQLNYLHFIGKQRFQQTHSLHMQYSHDHLYGTKQADLLGHYSVRGFRRMGLSAEKSVLLRNQFMWLPPSQKISWQPYLLLDVGVQKSSGNETHSQKALAYGIGVNAQFKRWQTSVEWATGRAFQPQQPVQQERTLWVSTRLSF